jgi:hypothetical protein
VGRRLFAQSATWLHDLLAPAAPAAPERIQRFMDEGAEINGTHVRVVELTGAAGDVILMHPWVLHAPAANCGTMPRFMVSESVYRSPQALPPVRAAAPSICWSAGHA